MVQVKGKVRGRTRVAKGASKETLEAAAREAVPTWLESGEVVKTIVVPGKLVNFIVK